MKKKTLRALSMLLTVIMIGGMLLTSCRETPVETTTEILEETTEKKTESTASEKTESTSTETAPSEVTDGKETTDGEGETNVEIDTADPSAPVVSEGETTDEKAEEVTTEGKIEPPVEVETEDPRLSAEYAPVLYFSAKDVYNVAKPGEWDALDGFRRVGMVMMDKEETYCRLYAINTGATDSNFPLLTSSRKGAQYLVLKYRTTIEGIKVEFFLDSENSDAVGTSSSGFISATADGFWNIMVFDLSKIKAYNGTKVNYIRFDFVNANPMPEGAYLDVQYIGMFNSIDDANKFEYGEDYVDPSFQTGNDYTITDLTHASAIDYINGVSVTGQGLGANSNKGAQIYNGRVWTQNGTDSEGKKTFTVGFSGWTVVEGGFSKIVWSVDGGATWHDVIAPEGGYRNGDSAHISAVNDRLGVTDAIQDTETSVKGCKYQGAVGVQAVLGEEYEGKEVMLQFAAIPNDAPDTLVPLLLLTKIDVGAVPGVADEEEEETIVLDPTDFSDSIEHADDLSNEVNVYFPNADRSELNIENKDFIYNLGLVPDGNQLLNSVTSKNNGGVFLKNTSDAYVIGANGTKYYASKTTGGGSTNIYRQGFYFYDVHVYGADFIGDIEEFDREKATQYQSHRDGHVDVISNEGGEITYRVTGGDPGIYYRTKAANGTYQFVVITAKTTSTTAAEVYFRTTSHTTYSNDRKSVFKLIADGEYHTYVIMVSGLDGIYEDIEGIRVDIGTEIGEEVSIKEVKMAGCTNIPTLLFDRTLYVYSDKVNQIMHLVAPSVNKIREYGWETVVAADTVSKLIVGDKNGNHTSLDDVDWDSAIYVAFDIKRVGILGYILLDDEGSGSLKVTLENGNYVIRQSYVPERYTINAGDDIYMGHRLYTKETHDFSDFLFEAYCEYNPLQNVEVFGNGMNSFYLGYNALRGAYELKVAGASWNEIYVNAQNRHFPLFAGIKGDEYDRNIYVFSSVLGKIGTLECAVMLDGNGNIVPINLEICKNFNADGEANVFLKDDGYSEAIFPLVIKAGSDNQFQLVHLYQNWGKFPLKQISSIQFYAPFYHLSTGVTETNCIRPWYDMNNKESLYLLPDFRAMSATLWMDIYKNSNGTILTNQPQHTNGGTHVFMQYVGEDGKIVYSENTQNYIGSYGPTYAEMDMVFITDDGKIKITYKHIEMPQTDENRTYYEIEYEILEDLTINNMLRDFAFYTVTGRNMNYEHLGYLNENNEHVIIDTNKKADGTTDLEAERVHVLGDQNPYFSLFEYREKYGTPDLDDYENNYVNTGFIVYDSYIEIGGEEYEGSFALFEQGRATRFTLNIDGEVTFKKGDKMTLDLILMPWGDGYGKTDYSSEYPNINVIEVRENSALNPFKVTAGANCTVLDSTFLPKVKSTDGKSAEFTVSGGENNVTVRVYGFDKSVRPTIYEYVGGEWVVYEVSSANTPDSRGNAHDYDGYMVHYDGNGSYSYSFVATITDGAPRTFKIVIE